MRSSEATELHGKPAGYVAPKRPPNRPVEATPKPRREPTERLANVERLRIVAMLEIVSFHVGGAVATDTYRLPIVGGLGLPVFLLLNNAFNCTLSERMGTRAFLDLKVSRLLLPWLIWSGVYAGIVLAEKVRHGEPLAAAFSPWMIIGGTYTHLWFVPFALFGSLLIAGLQARTKTLPHRTMLAVALGLGTALTLGAGWLLHVGDVQWPLLQWLFALPSPLLGFALGRVILSRDRRLLTGLVVLLSVLAVGTWAAAQVVAVPEMDWRYAVSMALVSLFFLWPGKADALSRRLTPLLFGIYLTHPLLMRLYQAAHLPELPVGVLGVVVFAAAAALVELLRRGPLKRLV
jgi:surface polysaccharide O-acyltransferase-like enzyme